MANHIHPVSVPAIYEGMHRVLEPLEIRYAQQINRVQGWKCTLGKGGLFHHPSKRVTWSPLKNLCDPHKYWQLGTNLVNQIPYKALFDE